MTQRRVDPTIIGASFAGLLCARAAALKGLRTVVIEARPEPGARIHTTDPTTATSGRVASRWFARKVNFRHRGVNSTIGHEPPQSGAED